VHLEPFIVLQRGLDIRLRSLSASYTEVRAVKGTETKVPCVEQASFFSVHLGYFQNLE
jgi:hypothetical protein